jgi:peptidoglycan/xylan/chitin deacetylase (PgdA/CDA1 family)
VNYLTPQQRRGIGYVSAGALGFGAIKTGLAGAAATSSILAVGSGAVLLIPSLLRNCSLYGQVVTRFAPEDRQVWLTIDDGPTPENTLEMLDVLSRHDALATFFCIGQQIAKHPELAIAIHSSGHSLQNHTYSHSAGTFWATTRSRASSEISECSRLIQNASGLSPIQFRAPAGLANPLLHRAVEDAGLSFVGWSASGFDGVPRDPKAVIQRIMHSVKPGAIILLHESSLKNMRPGTRARTLESLLKGLHEEGYTTTIPSLNLI